MSRNNAKEFVESSIEPDFMALCQRHYLTINHRLYRTENIKLTDNRTY